MLTINFSISNDKNLACNKFKENIPTWIGVSILVLALGGIAGDKTILFYGGMDITYPSNAGIIFGVIVMYLELGIIKMAINHIRGEAIDFKDLYSVSLKTFLNYIVAYIITVFFIIIGLILLIIPGIHLALRFMFAQYLIVDKDMSFDVAIKESMRMTKGNTINLFLLVLTFALIAIAGIICLFVGLIVACPVIWLAGAYIYTVFEQKTNQINEPQVVS